MEPKENQNPTTPPEAASTSPAVNTPPTEPQLTAQVDDLMATSAAANNAAAEPEVVAPAAVAPSTPEVIAPEVIAPSQPAVAAPIAPTAPTAPSPIQAPVSPLPMSGAPVVGGVAEPIAASAAATQSKKSWKKPALIAGVALVVIGLVGAAVFAEVIVPNRPNNVLMKALENSLQQKQVSYKGSLNMDSSGTAVKVDLSGSQDNDKQASDVQLTVAASGISLPVEARLVDKNAYIKFGDLTPIVSLLGALGDPSYTPIYTSISQQLSNKWISIDSTLLKQAGVSCVTDTKFVLTKADTQLIEDQLKKNPIGKIDSSSSDTVNGQKVTKYQISLDDDKAVTFSNNLDKLSIVQALNKCSKDTGKTVSKASGDHQTRPLTVWVDKGTKQIVQVATESTAKDSAKVSGKISFTYAPVSISAPTDSTPVLEVVANIQKTLGVKSSGGADSLGLSSLLSGFGGSQ